MTKPIKKLTKRSHHKKKAAHKPATKKPPTLRLMRHPVPKTLYAAVDTLGKPRFTNDDPGLVDIWIGKLKKFYSVQVYDLRTAKVAAKPAKVVAKPAKVAAKPAKVAAKPVKKPTKEK